MLNPLMSPLTRHASIIPVALGIVNAEQGAESGGKCTTRIIICHACKRCHHPARASQQRQSLAVRTGTPVLLHAESESRAVLHRVCTRSFEDRPTFELTRKRFVFLLFDLDFMSFKITGILPGITGRIIGLFSENRGIEYEGEKVAGSY